MEMRNPAIGASKVHIGRLVDRYPVLEICRNDLEGAFEILRAAFRGGRKTLICGNGGSASDAEHWAGELLKGFRKSRKLHTDPASLIANLRNRLQGGLPIIPLTGFPAFSTAFANDVAPELTFAQLVWVLGVESDCFIGISTSGHARNVCLAAEVAQGRRMTRIALTGEDGGDLRSLCDLTIRVPERETYLVQELHLPIYHCLSLMLEDEFFSIDDAEVR
jgi:D-sedoheptulose 7-phosphate isomerase